jgi:hypothetical protein
MKRRINETVKDVQISMDRVITNTNLNMIPLGYYDILIGMDLLDRHHTILAFHNNTFTSLDEKGK